MANTQISTLLATTAVLALSACGGGTSSTGGDQSPDAPYRGEMGYSSFDAQAVSALAIAITGRSSTNTSNTGYGEGRINLRTNSTPFNGVSNSVEIQARLFSDIHLRDTNATSAWANGWTGQGQTVVIIDDFRTNDITVGVPLSSNRTHSSTSSFFGTSTYEVDYLLKYSTSHGALVSNIAGGDGRLTELTFPFEVDVSGARLNSCSTDNCISLSNSPVAIPNIDTFFGDPSASTTYYRMAGVASEATLIENHVDLSVYQNVPATLAAIRGHVDNSADAAAINISIGYGINTVGYSYNDVLNDLDKFNLNVKSNAVITVAAGNSGAPCGLNNLNGCNAMAVAFTVLPQTRESTIVVGATEGQGASEKIASYSTRAGVLANRYLLASGDTGTFGVDEGYWIGDPDTLYEIQGTSFAAPRVAGAAAILRHKFPNLDGTQASSLLLLSANKDINNDGIDDFSGVSATFGHGKLDLMRALSPVGSLAVR